MNKALDILKRIAGTLMLPVIMFVVMKLLCNANGKKFLDNMAMWKVLIPDVAVSVACAMGIGLQFKNGRFDFSGGSIMLVSAIVAGSIARDAGTGSPLLYCAIAVGMCVLLSLGVALVYVYGRLPIMIATIGMALLYESITPLIFGGGGVNLVYVKFIKQLSAYRTAKAQMIYVSDGRRETVRAHFTYFGFRYVRVTGWPGAIGPDDFTGRVVYSDLETSMRFHCSNEKLNRLAQNAFWGQRSNFLDMPTDCPQRDERLGWTGDAQVFSPTACFQMDTRAFYRKFLDDLRVDQLKHGGAVANYLPNFGGIPSGSSVWGDIATFLPITLYDYYGDRADLGRQYPLMRDWLEWIYRQDEQNGGQRLWNFGFHFGDWLAQDGVTPQSMKGGTDDFFVASMYYYASARKVERAARILEMGEDAESYGRLAEAIRAAILREYFSPNGRLCVDTQTAYLLCLNFDVYVDRDRLLEGLKNRFRKDCFKIKGGFVGATMMCRVLAENGLKDLAAHFLFQEGFPGWLHCVNLGATTIWERWNSVLDDGSISGTGMNSLNHYSYGSVMEYVFRDLAGIQPMEPGFTRVRFAPQPTWRLKELSFAYDSVSGEYASHWRVNDDGTLTVRFEVPFGCAAQAVLPGCSRVIELPAGVWEETYRPDVDYRLKYTMNSRLDEMKDDPEALEILKTDLPGAWEMIASGDEEFMAKSLEELKTLFFRGFNPQMVAEGARRLLELKAN